MRDNGESKIEVEETAKRVNAIRHPSGGAGNTPKVEEVPVGKPRPTPGPNRQGFHVTTTGHIEPASPAE